MSDDMVACPICGRIYHKYGLGRHIAMHEDDSEDSGKKKYLRDYARNRYRSDRTFRKKQKNRMTKSGSGSTCPVCGKPKDRRATLCRECEDRRRKHLAILRKEREEKHGNKVHTQE